MTAPQCQSVKRQTLTLSSYVVVIVDGDGDVAVDDCSACQMRLLHESPCSAFRSSTVYRCAIEFLGLAAAAAEEVPSGNAALLDQLRRAASSIPLNIAEAAGRTGQADAARTDAHAIVSVI